MWICWAIFLGGRAGSGPYSRGQTAQGGSGLQAGGDRADWQRGATCLRAECRVRSVSSLELSRPGAEPRCHSEEGLGRLGWGHFRAVEICGAGDRALTPSAVARQMGDTRGSAVPPGWWELGGGQGWYLAVGQLGLGRMEEGADTHVMVVLSNCSARLSMADDCKYGSSLSVCLSVRCVSVLASPVFVLCGCPCPAHTLLRLPTWSTSVVPILVLPAWHWLLAGICPWPHLGFGGLKGPGQIRGAWMWGGARVSDGVGGDGDGAVPCNQGQPNPG